VYRIAAGVQSLAPNRWHWLAHMLIDPVSRLGASRGLWPVPGTASITHLNWNPTTPNWLGASPRFFSIQCVGPPGLSDFALHYYRGLRPRQRVFQPSGLTRSVESSASRGGVSTASESDGTRPTRPLCKLQGVASARSYARANSKAKGSGSQRNSSIPSNRDIDEVAFLVIGKC
jgi:hypothetical protein